MDPITFNLGSEETGVCDVPDLEAGYYNVTQKKMLNTGYANILNTIPTFQVNGSVYDFVIVPSISAISNNQGSSEGQIITIEGSGFSSTEQNEVYLADTPCSIISQTSTSIEYELQSRNTAISVQPYHSGLRYDFYQGASVSSVKSNTAGSPTITSSIPVTETPIGAGTYYTSKLSGYFKAPTTGNYKFFISVDDTAELKLAQTPLSKTNLQTIVSVGSYTPYKFYYTG